MSTLRTIVLAMFSRIGFRLRNKIQIKYLILLELFAP